REDGLALVDLELRLERHRGTAFRLRFFHALLDRFHQRQFGLLEALCRLVGLGGCCDGERDGEDQDTDRWRLHTRFLCGAACGPDGGRAAAVNLRADACAEITCRKDGQAPAGMRWRPHSSEAYVAPVEPNWHAR